MERLLLEFVNTICNISERINKELKKKSSSANIPVSLRFSSGFYVFPKKPPSPISTLPNESLLKPYFSAGCLKQHSVGTQIPRGVLEVYMTGGSNIFFWVENVHAWYFLGSRDLFRS